ncbi:hypothetical protein QJS66_10860 [Kocuria rhizophila]|nr:hypothetical protein QJS66_10860 [Kocuria rhizophila]
MIRSANDGLDITVETCPHSSRCSPRRSGQPPAFKCCPPVREVSNREKLWEGLIDGTINFHVSDHSPSTLDLKDMGSGDFGCRVGAASRRCSWACP